MTENQDSLDGWDIITVPPEHRKLLMYQVAKGKINTADFPPDMFAPRCTVNVNYADGTSEHNVQWIPKDQKR